MNLKYKEIPRGLKKFLRPYFKELTKPQQAHLSTLITGLVTHDNKTVQAINDALSKKDQSSLNRFLNNHDLSALNDLRLARVQRALPTSHDGLIIVDDTLAHKTGMHMQGAGWHWSGMTKHEEWGHCIVNSYYTHPDWKLGYPITADIHVKKTKDEKYRSKKQMFLEQVKYARTHGVRGVVCADGLFYADYVIHALDDEREPYVLGTTTNLKISIACAKRIPIAEHFERATTQFERVQIRGRWYHISSVWAGIRNVGTRRIVCSFPEGRDDDKRFYVANIDCSNKALIRLLVCRWRIESWHRDAKQHLGLEDYQVRKERAVRNVVLAVLIAYTILILSLSHSTLRRMTERIGRSLCTIGELCRFMQLAAAKGWRWITGMLRNRINVFKEILNREVLVKNAKV